MKRQNREKMLEQKRERRLLPHVPVEWRPTPDRRKDTLDPAAPQHARFAGRRYLNDFDVRVSLREGGHILGRCRDISQTGLLMASADAAQRLRPGDVCTLRFHPSPGDLPEGMEKHYRIRAKVVRSEQGETAFQFGEPLYRYLRRMKNSYLFTMAAVFLLVCVLCIVLLRMESILFFSSNAILYLYSLIAAAFLLTRYLFGALYRPVPVEPGYAPSITMVIPCYNEEKWIRRTILSCIDQDYPPEKLHVIIVEDGSGDGSAQVIRDTVEELCRREPSVRGRIRVFFQKQNQGKREGMALGIRNADTELVGFVDSDSFLEPDAVRHLVQPFADPKVGGVAGRTDVANAYTNSLTRMQCVRYYISFRILKAAESYFDSVMCLSGPLSAYRADAVRAVLDKWLNQSFLGQKATFGDDRSLTNYIVAHYRTVYQDTAVCATIVPADHRVFLRQQMRWKRSWLRESLRAASFMWRKEPLMVFSFYFGLLIPLVSPLIVLYNLVYLPLVHAVMPTTFLMGLLLMALLMSFTQLLLKKSRLWFYGLLFCLYYEFVLLWQMPWAWLTFWVSSWGTRAAPKTRPAPGTAP